MSATIYSQIVGLDEIIPRIETSDCEGIETCTRHWPQDDHIFRPFFYHFSSYRSQLGPATQITLAGDLGAQETVRIPSKSRTVARARPIRSQGMLLATLLEIVYDSLGDISEIAPIVQPKLRYVIGSKRYSAQSEGAAVVGSHPGTPIISYAGWFEGQSWNNFLAETLNIMLGQLAANLSVPFQDQDAFVVGYYGSCVFVARGSFSGDMISRVHSNGCSEEDVFQLKFTRGYDLSSKDDWNDAMRALTRLFRYLLSGNARIDSLRTLFHQGASASSRDSYPTQVPGVE
ncbi:hypothetical protein P170DRAFT_443215 [Aspergillus steynii IBT 23096]|uniref:Uncharacterized protein n=1 Tax=Aspergillus steynii IBT 23096 TaxID=1392250 RepID=A0A2I2GRB7_9EURO|nr:uncharacterized protein P170DRAFT_443215 [Aspergillus steynii IBT 23096]PLB55418.1 hypothetical protein P170DRAFT_443215 [Aspergillus steynii IBT 23096]